MKEDQTTPSELESPGQLDSLAQEARALRQAFTLNRLKKGLLGERHIPGEAQTPEVLRALDQLVFQTDLVEPRTWKSWFSRSPSQVQPKTLSRFDRFASPLMEAERLWMLRPGRGNYLSSLIHGGMLADVAAPTRSKRPKHAMAGRCADYAPASAVHLHFDAVEAAALAEEIHGVPWSECKAVLATRVVEILHEQWDPKAGSVYERLPTDARIQWDAGNELVREKLRAELEKWQPPMLEHQLNTGTKPNWVKVLDDPDVVAVHVHRFLLSLSMDPAFLRGPRFQRWALDLSTAGISAYALAWSRHYFTFGSKSSSEAMYWRAIFLVFLEQPDADLGSADEQKFSLREIAICDAMGWPLNAVTAQSMQLIVAAGSWYREWLAEHGISLDQIRRLVCRGEHLQKLTFVERGK